MKHGRISWKYDASEVYTYKHNANTKKGEFGQIKFNTLNIIEKICTKIVQILQKIAYKYMYIKKMVKC